MLFGARLERRRGLLLTHYPEVFSDGLFALRNVEASFQLDGRDARSLGSGLRSSLFAYGHVMRILILVMVSTGNPAAVSEPSVTLSLSSPLSSEITLSLGPQSAFEILSPKGLHFLSNNVATLPIYIAEGELKITFTLDKGARETVKKPLVRENKFRGTQLSI